MVLGRLLGRGERVTAVARVGADHGFMVEPATQDTRSLPPLGLRLADGLPPADAAFEMSALLDWRTRLAPVLVGRDTELASLTGWAQTGRRVRLRVVSGPAGAGKYRLVEALAAALPGWQAGVVPLAGGALLPFSGSGLLIVLERPETAPEQFRALLRAAALAESVTLPVRFVVLSRRPVASLAPTSSPAARPTCARRPT